MKSIFTIIVVALFAVGCMEFSQNEVVYDHELIGTWSDIQWTESGISMTKVKKLEKNTYGYIFNANGTLIARQNSGWCGTPPIITSDYEGTWILENGTIHIKLDYWGGHTTQEWQIANSSNKKVTINIANQEFHSKN